jgi:ribosomal protein S18 acetylase RimI-like enzyme
MVLADLGYRRFLLLERWLDEPIAAITPRLPVSFSELRPAQLDEYLRFHGQVPRSQLEERFARGDACVLARYEGRIVCTSWSSRDDHFFRSVRCRYEVGASEAYLYDSFTDPAFRGRGIAPALGADELRRFRRAGLTRVMMAVRPENVANRRARAKTGFRVFGRIDYLRLGGRSWHWHGTVDSHRDGRENRWPTGSCRGRDTP